MEMAYVHSTLDRGKKDVGKCELQVGGRFLDQILPTTIILVKRKMHP